MKTEADVLAHFNTWIESIEAEPPIYDREIGMAIGALMALANTLDDKAATARAMHALDTIRKAERSH